jgi:CTP:molybdopterin cytidylyltransferase MocA
MKTIVLASGKSSRCAPIPDKNFLYFRDRPLLAHLLLRAERGGLGDFIIVSNGENQAAIDQLCRSINLSHPPSVVVQEDLETGMAGGR